LVRVDPEHYYHNLKPIILSVLSTILTSPPWR
jgi:hypothetical protein